jgi:serine/threonine protein phosphatase PrpC
MQAGLHGETGRAGRSGDSEALRSLSFYSITDVGMMREENQDSLAKYPHDNLDLTLPKGQLFILADGMGGHNAGKEASELAVNLFAYYYYSVPGDDIAESLRRGFDGANDHIYNYSRHNPALAGMGTTCVVLVLRNDTAYFGNIGDSRIYRLDENQIEQLTRDHSRVAEMVRIGVLTREEAKIHPERSILYRSLGVRAVLEADIFDPITLRAHDYFLMCSDGLINYVEDEEIQRIVVSRSLKAACEELVRLAKERGGSDNITIQLIEHSQVLD